MLDQTRQALIDNTLDQVAALRNKQFGLLGQLILDRIALENMRDAEELANVH